MIVRDRRRIWLAVTRAGLEMAVLTPLLLWIYHRPLGLPALAVMALLWGLQCLWIVAVDLLSAATKDDRAFRRRLLAAMVLSSLLLVRVVAYGRSPLGDLGWVAAAVHAMIDFSAGLSPALLVLFANLLLWVRATGAGNQGRHFLYLSNGVRWLWVAAAGAVLWASSRMPDDLLPPGGFLPLVLIVFPLGLLRLVIGRIDEKSATTGSAGRVLPWGNVGQYALWIAAITGLGLVPVFVHARFLQGWIERAFSLVLLLAMEGLMLAVLVVYPALLDVIQWAFGLFDYRADIPFPSAPPSLVTLPDSTDPAITGLLASLPPWGLTALRIGVLVLLLAGAFGIALLLSRSLRARRRVPVDEDEAASHAEGGESLLRRGLTQLQELLAMARRIGVGQELLAAISVQNIFANLSRLASRSGHSRRKYQPPDLFVEELADVLGGYRLPLRRIAAAYMRVHYGDHDITPAELRQVQADFREVRGALEQPVD